MTYRLTRRASLALGTGAFVATALGPLPALALTQSGAKSLIDSLVGEINKVIASGKSETAMYDDFERIFARYSDTAAIASSAFGADARRASTAQKRAFSAAFQSYIARKYGSRFREFIGGRLEVQDVRSVKRWFEVSTTAYLRGESPFEVTFLVSNRTGEPKFFNMFIEGINLLSTERTEIGAMLDKRRGNIDAMITDLQNAK